MKYTEARELIQTGDLLGWYSDSLISNAIRRFTGSDFSHVGLAYWIEEGGTKRLCVAESREGKGVQLLPLRGRSSFEWIKNTAVQSERGLRTFVWEEMGKPYDWSSIFRRAIGLQMIQNRAWTCNEFASRGLIVGKAGSERVYQDPGALMKAYRQLPGRAQIYVSMNKELHER